MNTSTRQAASFRFKPELLSTLKRRTKESNRSLNNYVESVLLDAMAIEPNEETKAAIAQACSGEQLETLDLDHFDDVVKSL